MAAGERGTHLHHGNNPEASSLISPCICNPWLKGFWGFFEALKVWLNAPREGWFVFQGCSSPAVFHVYSLSCTESSGALFPAPQ